MKVPAAEDDFRILTRGGSFNPVPASLLKLLPRSMTYSTPFDNHGNSSSPSAAHAVARAQGRGRRRRGVPGFCRRAGHVR